MLDTSSFRADINVFNEAGKRRGQARVHADKSYSDKKLRNRNVCLIDFILNKFFIHYFEFIKEEQKLNNNYLW